MTNHIDYPIETSNSDWQFKSVDEIRAELDSTAEELRQNVADAIDINQTDATVNYLRLKAVFLYVNALNPVFASRALRYAEYACEQPAQKGEGRDES